MGYDFRAFSLKLRKAWFMKIAIFDSGIGGVTVLHEALLRVPDAEYIFYADTDHVPYGTKTSEEIKGFVDNIVDSLVSLEADAIVIACNTATAVAAEHVRNKYSIPIIGMEPAVKPAVEVAKKDNGRVLVMATPVTIRENKLHSLLSKVDTDHMVDLLPMPGLVRFAENEIFDEAEVDEYIEEQLAVFDKSAYSEVVLGCTHFNYFKPAIRKAFANEIKLIDGNVGTIKHLADKLKLPYEYNPEKILTKSDYERIDYLVSGRPAGKEDLSKFGRLHERLNSIK